MRIIGIISYFAVLIFIGLYWYFKAQRDENTYWIAGGSVGPFLNGIAIGVTAATASTYVGHIGMAYKLGIPWAMSMGVSTTFAFLLVLLLYAAPMRKFAHFTLPDYLSARFESNSIRFIIGLIIFIAMAGYLVPQLKAAGNTLQEFLGVGYKMGVIISGCIFALYVSLGGMWAITWTDFFQGLMMVVFMVLLALVSIFSFGGIGGLWTKAMAIQPHHLGMAPNMGWYSYLGLFCLVVFGVAAFPHLIMRLYAALNPKEARRSMFWGVVTLTPIYVMGVPFITGAALILAPDLKNADMAFVTAVNGLLPPFLAGFTGAAILAAIMSSTDAMLLACSAVVAHDIYAKLINPQADTKFVVRLGSIVVWIVAIIVILLAFNPPALLSVMVAQVIGVLASTFFPVLTLGVWWDRTSKAGAWTGLVVGLVVYVGLKFLFHMPLLTELFIALPLSFAVTIVVSLFTPKVSDETLQRTCYGIHL